VQRQRPAGDIVGLDDLPFGKIVTLRISLCLHDLFDKRTVRLCQGDDQASLGEDTSTYCGWLAQPVQLDPVAEQKVNEVGERSVIVLLGR
jgi:hypothetical protein